MENVFARSTSRGSSNRSFRHAQEGISPRSLPSYTRLGSGIYKFATVDDKAAGDRKVGDAEQRDFTREAMEVEEKVLRNRSEKGRLSLPTVEVRFEHLTVETECHLGRRALPTLINATQNMIESTLGAIGIRLAKRTRLHILNNISGVIKPSRLTLLLGPPSSGKTTLLKALAGRLDPTLKVGGMVTYNGHKMEEFVVQKTSAYISQNNIHTPELTVRETLDFAARCHGVSDRYELLSRLVKREKDASISPSAKVDFIMKILGLDDCDNIIVGDMLRRGISGGQKKRLTTGSSLAYPTTLSYFNYL
ncbi:ABC transporter G family member 35 [Dendrobium catenatum]|uniref:ABC transporter G family member 35 n=1 Tax=Dendrobium catenatum TaxID=906689 RepID=A0A2I0W6D2_9ASPA|nr:ABC transporter G family member 35 [Dendrobium catenatum]